MSRASSLEAGPNHGTVARFVDKFSHLAMMLSLDAATSASQIHDVSTA